MYIISVMTYPLIIVWLIIGSLFSLWFQFSIVLIFCDKGVHLYGGTFGDIYFYTTTSMDYSSLANTFNSYRKGVSYKRFRRKCEPSKSFLFNEIE